MGDTFTLGSPVFFEGQRAGALQMERKHTQKQQRHAASPARAAGRLGSQHTPGAGCMVRFAGGAPAGYGDRTPSWGAGEPSGKGGKGTGASAGGGGRFGQERGGFQHSSN